MTSKFGVFVCVFALLVAPALAEKKDSVLSRGGLGYLFEDAAGFENAGQLARNRGKSLGFEYTRVNHSEAQALTPTFTWSNAKLALGLQATRSGNDLASAQTNDHFGAELGLSLAQGRVTAGVVYDRSLDVAQTSDGEVSIQLTMNVGKDRVKGLSLGVATSTTLNQDYSDTRTGLLAIGWNFNGRTHMELIYKIDDFSEPATNRTISGVLTLATRRLYVSGRYDLVKRPMLDPNQVTARVGFLFLPFDVSASITKVMLPETPDYTYGGSLRVQF